MSGAGHEGGAPTTTARVVIIGAGPTALGAAERLAELGFGTRPGQDVRILEASDRVGGLSASFRDARGFLWDLGGHVAFSSHARFHRMLDRALGAGPEAWNERIRAAYVYDGGRFVPYPLQQNLGRLAPADFEACVEGWRARPAPKPDGSFDDWILAQFGAGVADLFMRPYNRKVWRVDPTEMSATWVEDRVAGLSAEVIARGSAPSMGWGPNARFRYPRRGGTGAIWQGLAARLPGGWLQTNAEVVEVRPEAKVLRCQGPLGARWLGYDVLINTSPLDAFVARLGGLAADPVRRAAARLRYTSTHVIGLGLRGRCPEALADKTWIYLPASEPPVHRVTVFSAYSDDHVPEPGRTWSLLCEASETQGERQSPRSIVAATVRGLEALGWLRGAEVESTWHRLLVRGYPVPTRERDALLDTILPWLEARQIYSRGRFGQWRYELGNQDHSYMQGVELVDRLLLRAEEGARAS